MQQGVLEQWHELWTSHIRPELAGRPLVLDLNFICDVSDVATGALAVQPFLNEPEPLVKACSIRLSPSRNTTLARLARKAVRSMTGSYVTKGRSLEGTMVGHYHTGFHIIHHPPQRLRGIECLLTY